MGTNLANNNENGYVVYPDSVGFMKLDEAIAYADENATPATPYRVEGCDDNETYHRTTGFPELTEWAQYLADNGLTVAPGADARRAAEILRSASDDGYITVADALRAAGCAWEQ